jgi:uncharacterized protein
MRTSVLALAALTTVLGSSAAAAASFNCARAAALDQRTICADRLLNDQDVRMAVMLDISRHFLAMGRRGQLDDEQTDWLRGRRACGANKQCLAAAYAHRIARLQEILDEVARQGPF